MGGHWCPGRECLNDVDHRDQLCPDCWCFRVVIWSRLPMLWVNARALLPPGAAKALDGVMIGATEPRDPINLKILDAVESTIDVLTGWVRVLALREGESVGPIPTNGWGRLTWAREQLQRLERTVEGELLGIDYYNCLHKWYRYLVILAGDARPYQHIDTPCPECDRVTVISRNGHQWFHCLTCEKRWGEAGFRAAVAQAGNNWVTGPQPGPMGIVDLPTTSTMDRKVNSTS